MQIYFSLETILAGPVALIQEVVVLNWRRVRLDTRIFTMQLRKHGNKLSRLMVDAPTLETFRMRVLNNLI